ncbi:DUF3099 domain-containing protein [Gordonia crocea]|uniref:DUF3099 domain-containing protein n=1 Tax=Gordonia crocea TaxID=589162 RepID=A0A7I9UYW2_9ACTN|nr:DUF3099 domain-containing protein [Gordonia crocea]GED98143.1 hypothetical protein nbrc107697_21820 [Gordonia crocea]
MRAHAAEEAFLITRAENSPEEQHRARVRKYLIMMAFRVPALILACIVYGWTHNGLLALAVVAVSIPLPWVAVLVANDRPARSRNEVAEYHYGHHREEAEAALEAPSTVVDSELADPRELPGETVGDSPGDSSQ